jgi:hypothetical protein
VRGKLPMTVIAERLAINKRTLERDRELPPPASFKRHSEGG